MGDNVSNLFACLGTPQLDTLKSDGARIFFRFKARNKHTFAEVRVIFDSERIFAQCMVNRETVCGRDVLEEFKKIVSTAIAMSVEL
jgi:hypothetical protein